MPPLTLDDVRRAVTLAAFDAESAWQRMMPRPRPSQRRNRQSGEAKAAAVLILLYPRDDALSLVLTRRTETVNHHKGQISLPGGAIEPDDPSPSAAALREACEELAVCRADAEQVEVLGELTTLYAAVSGFQVTPVVGYIAARPAFHPNPDEVAEVLEMPLDDLLADSTKVEERWTIRDMELDVPFYRVAGQAVWGMTATVLSELEGRLRDVLTGG
jgi:8-oxo-dGTP pyrophosphatase MutT (NUDIX family)